MVLATFIVPGINLSVVWFVNFNNAVCGANAPIPSTSKKLTTNPIAPVLSTLMFSRFFLFFTISEVNT